MAVKKSSVIAIVGVGCFALVLAVAIVIFVVAQKAIEIGRDIEQSVKNPEPKAMEVLSCESFPPDYHAQLAMSIPFLMDLVILSNEIRVAEGDVNMGGDGLIYMKLLWGAKQNQELRDFFEGKTNDPRALRDANINLGTQEIITRGAFDLDDQRFLYLVQRGDIQTDHGDSEGLSTVFLVQCGSESKMRLGIRYGSDPTPAMPAEDLDLTGTVGDVEMLQTFLSHFRFCR